MSKSKEPSKKSKDKNTKDNKAGKVEENNIKTKKKNNKENTIPKEAALLKVPKKHKKAKSKKINDSEELIETFSSKWIPVSKLKKLEEESGRQYKRGKFSRSEKEIVERQIQYFLKDNELSLENFKEMFLGDRKTRIDYFRNFFVQVAKLLPGRPVINIYHYLRRLYHPGNLQGQWLPEEDKALRNLYALHGPQWEMISKELGRFNQACRDRYRWIQGTYTKGPWKPDEVTRLIDAVTKYRREDISPEHRSLGAWSIISEKVQTRSWHQCLFKWTSSLSVSQITGSTKPLPWDTKQDLILLNRIFDLQVNDASEIIWAKLIDDSWNMWTPYHLRQRFKFLQKRIRDSNQMSFDDLVEALIRSLEADYKDENPTENK